MLQELIYTSAPAGLKPGSQGFCTVACTTGMQPNLAKLLETLSGYRHVFLPPDPNVTQNPAACSHLLLSLGGVPWHILSRSADAGLDYTQRINKISHHLVLDKAEQQEAGPAAVLTQYPFQTTWNQKPVILAANKKLPTISSQTRVCEHWAKLAGDAGWGGVLAETALTKRPVSIIFRPGMNMLPLIDEAMALLPPEVRWQISFSTYCCNLPNGTGCQWKCILAGSPEMAQSQLVANTLVIDLTKTMGPPSAGQWVEAARTGKQLIKQEGIIPLAIQGSEQPVYGIKDTGTSPPVGPPANPAAVAPPSSDQATQSAQVKPAKSAKGKKKNSDDVSSKGCFWLIIMFFILITAGMIGGLFWLYGGNATKEQSVASQERSINELQNENADLNRQIENDKSKYARIAEENAGWQSEKGDYEKRLREKNDYIDRVADYFSLFPQMSLPSVSVNVKDGIPRKDGNQDPFNELIGFSGTVDTKWNVKDMFSVSVTCSDDQMNCFLSGTPVTYQSGNVLLGIPCRLFAQKSDDSFEPIADFELIMTESGISVRRFNDDLWNQYVEANLKKLYDAENGAAFKNDKFIAWYEANVKDKTFVLDEAMLKKIDELDADVFAGDYADVARLIKLRKDYFSSRITLEFVVDVKLKELASKIKNDK